jgi:hypothetical protein
MSNSRQVSEVFKSTVSTGEAPFQVNSTTVVANLNADMLDGQQGNYYAVNTEVVNISTNFNNRISTLETSNSSITGAYTLLSTTAGLTASLQNQINNKVSADILRTEVSSISSGLNTRLTTVEGRPIPDIFRTEVASISSGLLNNINTRALNSDVQNITSNYILTSSVRGLTGSLQNDINARSLTTTVSGLTGSLQNQINSLPTNSAVSNISGNLQNQINLKANISTTVQTTGNQSVQGVKTFTNDVVINSNLFVNGTNFIVNTATVSASDNVIEINGGEVGPGVTRGFAGLRVDRGSQNDFMFAFDEVRDRFVVGTVTSETSGQVSTLQVVATREDNPINGGFAVFNPSLNRFDTTTGASITGALNSRVTTLEARPIPDIFRTEVSSISSGLQTQINNRSVIGHNHVANDISDASFAGKEILKNSAVSGGFNNKVPYFNSSTGLTDSSIDISQVALTSSIPTSGTFLSDYDNRYVNQSGDTMTGILNSTGFVASTSTGRVGLGTDGGGSVSIGRQTGENSTPYIDFNAGANIDYDVRIQVVSGSGSTGGGDVTVFARNLIHSGTKAQFPTGTTDSSGVSNPSISFSADQDTGFASPTANQIDIIGAGRLAARIGQGGIQTWRAGSTPPNANDFIAAYQYGSHDGVSGHATAARLRCYASETWAPTAHGSGIQLRVTSNGTASTEWVGMQMDGRDGWIDIGNGLAIGGIGRSALKWTSSEGVVPDLQVFGANANESSTGIGRFSNDGTGPRLILAKSRSGVNGSWEGSIQSGNVLGEIVYEASDGSNPVRGARIVGVSSATPSASNVPARIEFHTRNTGGTLSERARIGDNGVLSLAGTVSTPSYSFIGDEDTGIHSVSANVLGFSTNGVERVSIGATGYTTLENGLNVKGLNITAEKNININRQDGSAPLFQIQGPDSVGKAIFFYTGTVAASARWGFECGLESAGAHLSVNSYNASGGYQDTLMQFRRDTNQVSINNTANPAIPDLTFIGDLNTGIYSPTSDTIGFVTNGTERFQINNNGMRLVSTTVPGTSGATGSTGQISYDSNYIYVCTAANTWKRAALTSW